MTALELKVNALVLIEIGSTEEQEEGRNTLRMLRDGLYPAPVLEDTVDELMEELNLIEGRLCVQMIRTALIQGYLHPELMECFTRGIYKTVGEIYQVSPVAVAQSITRGIEIAYRFGNSKELDGFFRYQVSSITGTPTPTVFLWRCLKELRQRMEVTIC